jgi:RAT1-interacting protein
LLPAPWSETDRDYIENRENEIVSNYAQYCSIVRTGIGGNAMILGGEVDAGELPPDLLIKIHHIDQMTVWDRKPDDGSHINWVELKTSMDIRGDRDMVTFERKLMKFWIQSFLLGVPKIIVGFRSPNGVLQRVEEIATATIPATVKREGRGTWDGNMCINFASGVLDCKSIPSALFEQQLTRTVLKANITGDGVWRIRRKERSSTIEVFKHEETGHGDILPDDFINWRIKLAMREADKAKEMAN